jgi:hypothetical protein
MIKELILHLGELLRIVGQYALSLTQGAGESTDLRITDLAMKPSLSPRR